MTSYACGYVNGLSGVFCRLMQLLNYVIPVLIALGVVYFVWGVVQYFIGGGDEAKTEGRNKIIFGIIGLAVIIAMWGLVYLLVNTFFDFGGIPGAPGTFGSPSVNNLLPQ